MADGIATVRTKSNAYPFIVLGLLGIHVLCACYMMVDTTGYAQLYLLSAIQLTPMILAFITRRFTFLAFIMLVNFVTYSLAKYNQAIVLNNQSYFSSITIQAFNCQIGTSVLLIMTYIVTRRFLNVPVHTGRYRLIEFSKWQVIWLSLFFAFHQSLAQYVPVGVRTLFLALGGGAMVLLLSSKISDSKWVTLLIRVGIGLTGLYHFLTTGSLALLGYVTGALFIVGCLRHYVSNIFPVILFIILLSTIQTVKADYRTWMTKYESSQARGQEGLDSIFIEFYDRFGFLASLIEARFFEQSTEKPEGFQFAKEDFEEDSYLIEDPGSQLASGFSRVGDDSLERVLSWTPSKVPFWNGETYEAIIYMMIPRFMWPSKPTWTQWNKFGRVYGFLSEEDHVTSVGVSYFGEGYMNFGYQGMILVALFMGCLIGFSEKISYLMLRGPYCGTFLFCAGPFMVPNSNLGPILNSLMISIGFLFLARKFLLKEMRRKTPPPTENHPTIKHGLPTLVGI